MKKFICYNFPGTFGLKATKRFVFELSAGEKAEKTSMMESEVKPLENDLSNENKPIDKAKTHTEAETKLVSYILREKTALTAKRNAETDAKKKELIPSDTDLATALEAIKSSTLGKLDKAVDDAEKQRKANAETYATSISATLIPQRREESEGAFAKNAELSKRVDTIDFENVAPKISYTVGGKEVNGQWQKGENKTDHWFKGNMSKAVIAALKVIYIEEGKVIADQKVQQMHEMSKGFSGKTIGPEEMKTVLGFNGGDALQYAGDNEMAGNAKSFEAEQIGRIWGLAYEAKNTFKDDDLGKKALAEYTAHVRSTVKSMEGKKTDAQKEMIDSIATPTEWAMAHPEYVPALKRYTEKGDTAMNTQELIDKVKDSGLRETFRTFVAGAVSPELSPKQQEALLQKIFKEMGKSPKDVASLTFEDLKKVTDSQGRNSFGDGVWKMENVDNIADKARGYLSGLMYSAETLDYGKYAEDLSASGKTHDVAIRYKAYIAEQTDSKVMKDVLAKQAELVQIAKKNPMSRIEIYQKEEEILASLRSQIKSPKQFAAEIYDKEWKEKNADKDGKITEAGFVGTWLTELPRGQNPYEYDRIEGALLSAIKGQKPGDWHKLIEERLAAMGSTNPNGYVKGGVDSLNKFNDNLAKGREVYNADWSIDPKSKGYVSGLILGAEKLGGEDKEFATKYRAYIADQMKALDADPKFKDALNDRNKSSDTVVILGLKPGTPEYDAAKQRSIDLAEKKMFAAFQEIVKMTPEEFKKKLDEDKKSQEKAHDDLLAENGKFLDTYGADEKLDYKNAKASLKAIFDSIPPEIAGKNTDAIAKKQAELNKKMDGLKVGKNKNPERLGILAEAQGYVEHLKDEKNSETRYVEATDNYRLTRSILVSSTKPENATKLLKGFAAEMAASSGNKDLKDEAKDPLKTALETLGKAKEEDRADILAQQLLYLNGEASKDKKSVVLPTGFNQETFKDYSKYIAGKKTDDKNTKGTDTPVAAATTDVETGAEATPKGVAPSGEATSSTTKVEYTEAEKRNKDEADAANKMGSVYKANRGYFDSVATNPDEAEKYTSPDAVIQGAKDRVTASINALGLKGLTRDLEVGSASKYVRATVGPDGKVKEVWVDEEWAKGVADKNAAAKPKIEPLPDPEIKLSPPAKTPIAVKDGKSVDEGTRI